MSSTTHSLPLSTASRRAVHGIVGGLAGGVVFGLLMQMMGTMKMSAQVLGSDSILAGWVLHLAISSFIGGSFAILFGSLAKTYVPAGIFGMAYGELWWVLGALWILPAQLGLPLFEFSTTAWESLIGHLLFGLVLGLVFTVLVRRDHD